MSRTSSTYRRKSKRQMVVDKRPDSLAAIRAKGTAFALLVQHHADNGSLPVMMRLKRRFYTLGQTVQRTFF